MKKEQETSRQQMILIVSIFLAVILVAWIISLGWSLNNIEKNDNDGSVENLMGGLEKSFENFNSNISNRKADINNLVVSLRNKFEEQSQAVDSITDSMLAKLQEAKLENWSEYLDQNIYFKYPTELLLEVGDNIISLRDGSEDILSIMSYDSAGDLPDNINSLSLVEWLDEQVDRELGVYSSYEILDINDNYDMHKVNRKDDSQTVALYWQKDNMLYKASYVFKEEYNNIIELIISTIK